MRFLIALQFLTIIPVAIRKRFGADELARSMIWFPAVGALLGLALAGANAVLSVFFAPLVTAAALAALLALMTGGLHLDGVADVADAMFSGKGRRTYTFLVEGK